MTRSRRTLTFLKVAAHPGPNAHEFGEVAGAIAHIWVLEEDIPSAEGYAREYIAELGWVVDDVELRLQPSDRQLAQLDDSELACCLSACRQGIAATFFAYISSSGSGTADAPPAPLVTRRIVVPKPNPSREAAFWSHEQSRRRNFSAKRCIHPEASQSVCSKVARAHSAQRNGVLSRIARDGHVYAIDSAPTTLRKEGGIRASLVGIGRASTFAGLCALHDDATFASLEKRAFVGSAEQCFLLAYRAVLRATYVKRAAAESVDSLRQFLASQPGPKRRAFGPTLDALAAGTRSGLQAVTHHKSHFDDVYLRRAWDELQFVCIQFSRVPDLAIASAWNPVFDFDGRLIEDNADRLASIEATPDLVTISLLGSDEGGAFVLGWHVSSDRSCNSLAATLLCVPEECLCDAIVRLAFESSENIFMRPDWWEELQQAEQDELLLRFTDNVDLTAPLRPDALCDDGRRLASWQPHSVRIHVTR